METLRIIDFGRVSGLRSQTLWHAIAEGVSSGSPPTLAYMQPDEPYVSIGYHRSVEELAPDNRLPVFRRMVGGGPVYIDDGQHFFQIIVPLRMASASRAEAIRSLLAPAVEAFNDVAIPAELDASNEVVVGDQKICGHAAGQIAESVVVVGNLINSFDHEAAAAIVNTPSEIAHDELLTLMRRYVSATPAEPARFLAALAQRYGEALDVRPETGQLSSAESGHLAEYDAKFIDPEWVKGGIRSHDGIWRVKIKSGVWVGSAALNGHRVTAAFHGTDLVSTRLEGSDGAFEGMNELLDQMAARPPI